MATETIYHGPNRDGTGSIVIIAHSAGNGKTGDAVSLVIAAVEVFGAVKASDQSTHGRARAYWGAIKENIEAACGKCMFAAWVHKERDALNLKRCYAQHNYQNVGQPAKIIWEAKDTLPEHGVFQLQNWQNILRFASYTGVKTIRSAVVGDLGMVPVDVATAMIDNGCGFEWLGYTHQWFRSEHLKSTHQASTQGPWKAAQNAQDRGWSVYHALPEKDVTVAPSFVLCEAQQGKLAGVRVTCAGCTRKCDGSGNMNYIIDHGAGANLKRAPAGMVALKSLTIAA